MEVKKKKKREEEEEEEEREKWVNLTFHSLADFSLSSGLRVVRSNIYGLAAYYFSILFF